MLVVDLALESRQLEIAGDDPTMVVEIATAAMKFGAASTILGSFTRVGVGEIWVLEVEDMQRARIFVASLQQLIEDVG